MVQTKVGLGPSVPDPHALLLEQQNDEVLIQEKLHTWEPSTGGWHACTPNEEDFIVRTM